jgi:hypothetical protein
MAKKMDTKKLLVSLSLAVIAIFMIATVSASLAYDLDNNYNVSYSVGSLTNTAVIQVDGINVRDAPSVVAGDYVVVSVEFTANVDATDVTVEIELDGNEVVSKSFDVEANQTYKKSLKVEVPFDLKDDVSNKVRLNVMINGEDSDGDDVEKEFRNIALNVQRPSYNPEVKSVTVSQSVEAGETFPVSIVLKNMGYNELEDAYITVAIAELGVYKTAYFGDLVSLEDECDSDDDNCDDTVTGELFLKVPYGVEAGVYTLEVSVTNDEVEYSVAKQLVIENDFSSNVIVTASGKTVSVGEKAEYTFLLVNPTNNLKVYTLAVNSASEVSTSTETVVAVPAGSSKLVTLTAEASEEGQYNVVVNVLSGNDAEEVTFSLTAEKNATNPVIVLTVILAIIFLVLLVVLIVLLGRKPAKTEEFGESYY